MDTDVVIAGAGLAGACAALALSRTRRVLVLDATAPAAGASGAAAGLVNPFMARAARPAWRHAEALNALRDLLDDADAAPLFAQGLLRPARSESQADAFRARAAEHPSALGWLTPDAARERFPALQAPWGVLDVRDGGAIPIPALVRAVLAAAARRGAVVRSRTAVRGWRTTPDGVAVETSEATFHARHLVLAAGDGLFDLLPDGRLPLHRVKGQTVVVERPPRLDLPAVSGAAYAVPQGDTVVVGASFEHVFADLAPSEAVGAALLAQAAALVPALAGARVVAHRAGVRLTVPVRHAPGRLPLLDALPGHPGVWVFAGLGAKGLLTAPLLAATLDDRLDGAPPHPDLPRL